MRRVTSALYFLLLTGCGSCVEDKKAPEVEQTPSVGKAIMRTTDAGKRAVQVGEGPGFAGIVTRTDAGADGGS
jgi:hypothetical protein